VKKILIATVLFCLSGCMTTEHLMPGYISQTASIFDDAQEITLKSAGLFDSSGLSLGLFWRTPMQDDVLIIAEVGGAHIFDSDQSIQFKIDGKITELPPANNYDSGEIDTKYVEMLGVISKSKKQYMTNKLFIRKILNAQKVLVRVDLHRGYVEGRFSVVESDNLHQSSVYGDLSGMYAYNAFSKFYKKVWVE